VAARRKRRNSLVFDAAVLAAVSALFLCACSPSPPTVKVVVRRLDGPRPPQILSRCITEGYEGRLSYHWRFPKEAHPVGVAADEDTILLLIPEPPYSITPWVECTVTDSRQRHGKASGALMPAEITSAPARAKTSELITVRGSGFGPERNGDEGIWFVPAAGAFGRSRLADHDCKGAAWSDTSVSACVPPSLAPGAWQLRLQATGALARASAPIRIQ
jgi:hypothetical protein